MQRCARIPAASARRPPEAAARPAPAGRRRGSKRPSRSRYPEPRETFHCPTGPPADTGPLCARWLLTTGLPPRRPRGHQLPSGRGPRLRRTRATPPSTDGLCRHTPGGLRAALQFAPSFRYTAQQRPRGCAAALLAQESLRRGVAGRRGVCGSDRPIRRNTAPGLHGVPRAAIPRQFFPSACCPRENVIRAR